LEICRVAGPKTDRERSERVFAGQVLIFQELEPVK